MSLHAVMQSVKEEQAEVAVKQQNDAPSEAGSLSPTDQTPPRDPLERFERRQRRYSHDEALRMKASLVKEADETAGKLASPIPFGSPSDSLLSPTSKAVNRFNERRPRRRSHEESKSDVRDVRAGSLVALGFEGLSGRYPTGSAINLKRRPNMKPFTPYCHLRLFKTWLHLCLMFPNLFHLHQPTWMTWVWQMRSRKGWCWRLCKTV